MNLKFIFPILITLIVILIFHYTQFHFVKLYPVVANMTIFLVFFTSLFTRETIIQKIARTLEGGMLDNFTSSYTRKITCVWCIFMFINLLISIVTIFLPEKLWALYNGLISYLAAGTVFGVEYIVRIILRGRYKR